MKDYTKEEMDEFYQEYQLGIKPTRKRMPKPPELKLQNFSVPGPAYIPKYDKARLRGQTARIYDYMSSSEWHTLSEIETVTGAPQASGSACLRSFRRADLGSHTVERRRRGNPEQGLYEYRLIINGGI